MNNDTFMKEKPIFSLVLTMSLPMVLSCLLYTSSIRESLSLAKLHIFLPLRHALIRRTDDLAVVGQLLDAVGAPA